LSLPSWAPLAALAILCAAAAWLDLTQRRIPNWLCGVTAVAGFGLVVLTGTLGDLGSHAGHMIVALLIGMALFALGGFGGGDAKFYAGVAAWFGLGKALLLLLSVALSGLVLLVGWFVYRRVRGIPVRRTRNGPFDGLPYGMAIASGALVAMVA
jgi:prepilin peptidase CpaA